MTDFPNVPDLSAEVIQFHTESIDFELPEGDSIKMWIQDTIAVEQKHLVSLNFIFCDDAYLYEINVTYLNHDTLTDVITFPYTEDETIEGDIYISIDRIKENAQTFDVPFLHELKRVMIHGVLHLCGYGDKNVEEQKNMRAKENFYLEKIKKES